MPLRSFVAPDGAVWQVWGVAPPGGPGLRSQQRRVRDRRSPDPVFLYKGPDRRTGERRRALTPALESGWLVFESVRGKRRLSPPPDGWDLWPEPKLVELWNRASAVTGAPRAPTEL
jgi:hypothetical protein